MVSTGRLSGDARPHAIFLGHAVRRTVKVAVRGREIMRSKAMSDAIVLEKARKTFGSKVALKSLDLVIPRGSLFGFSGPNGAGKTTSIRLILSILTPDEGRVSVLGHGSALEAKDRIGYLPEERGLYRKMKVGAFLKYIGRLKGVEEASLRDRLRSWLERVGLGDVENKRCEELSKGMQQKVQFLAAVLHEPELLILDEPFSGLDPVNMRLLRDLVLEQHARGATVLFSTHVMHQAEQICDHIVMINQGDKVLDETMDAVRSRYDPRTILFEPLDGEGGIAAIGRLPGVATIQRTVRGHVVSLTEGSDVSDVMRAIVSIVTPRHLELQRPTLEDVFISLVAERGVGTA
jgi:ABC-2 type transport system ATP-binding protein